ncbi:hybrid sensor histidine kinase/response regulator [Ideonella sp.]|uniref:hybrid sensor histidine kinase/response regulator n=1 Tax=Ideonella sp. TaxID=1929293 RepID=UPI002B48AC73|nr:response regulator [Ideonella sp.]HJV68781.1 response regulator [Ideonella sp.]
MNRVLKLLVVEDSEDDARLALRALRRGGFELTHRRVQDIDALLGAFHEEHWDAVISDFSMPGFSGIDALNAFRTTGIDIPFIFVSGTIGEETAVRAMKAGASDYVMKQNLTRLAPALERELNQAAVRAERRQAELDLRQFEAQLRHAQKMESIGTLAGGIAHDFNNILGAILGNATLLRQALGPDHPCLVSIDEIQRVGLRARELVRQILAFSRKQPQELRVQPLAPIVAETHTLLRATLPTRVSLEAAVPPASPCARADATQVQQVLMNLCTNAWHALPDGTGRITIGLDETRLDAGSADLAALGEAGVLAPGRYAHLWVSDTGVGMDAAVRERIFEPFFTTKPVGQGTGLGLSVVHGIVTSHGGGIRVDSEAGLGTTFHLYFPACDMPAAGEAEPARATVPVGGRGERVVYIDDDETMMLVAARLLQGAGYEVSAYTDARAAIDAVRAAPESVDLVVTDFNMPDCSGLDVAGELAFVRPDLPVIISSGYLTEDLRTRAAALGVRGLLEKENSFEQLCPLVAQVLAAGS